MTDIEALCARLTDYAGSEPPHRIDNRDAMLAAATAIRDLAAENARLRGAIKERIAVYETKRDQWGIADDPVYNAWELHNHTMRALQIVERA